MRLCILAILTLAVGSAKMTDEANLLESEGESISFLCPFENGSDAPWLYPAASKTTEDTFALLIGPRPNQRDLNVAASFE